jgi:C-terminal processing protease CtpA/Prc
VAVYRAGAAREGEIVFQNGAGLYLLDLEDADAKPKAVSVTIPGDRPALRARQVDVSGSIGGWSISPSGKRVAAEARGDIWSLPAERGTPRNLTRSSGSAQRDPSWSPDGRWIAYFCDSSGEYELYVQQSDGLAEAVRLTKDGSAPPVFRYSPVWSPDSKMVAFTDKSGAIHLCTLGEEDGKGGFKSPSFKTIDTDPWANQQRVSWSHDGRWIAYARQDEASQQGSVWLYNVGSGQKTRVTSGMFDDSTPTFDRKGDYLFFTSKRTFSPTYSDLDTTFIYTGTNVLMAAPLRKDLDSPWAPKSDEEEWRKAAEKAEGDKADKKDEKKDEKKEGDAAADDGVTGAWDGTATGPEPLPPGGMPFGLNLKLGKDGAVTGTLTSGIYSGPIASGHWDAAAKLLTFVLNLGDVTPEFSLKLDGGSMTGTATVRGSAYTLSAKRAAAAAKADDKKPADKAKDKKEVVIDLEGLEARAMLVPVPAGRFGNIAVNDKGQLIYARLPVAGSGEAGIKLFDLTDEKKEEKTVASGAGFELTADGKKILVLRGSSAQIQDAAAGGSGKSVVTSPMTASIDPREEWKQIFTDAWRIERDFFYDPGMHGVDWKGMRERYGKMVDDAASRDDLSFIISEMISELNVGHAYYSGGDVENGPSVSVGMLGCDFELVKSEGGKPDAYRITKILRGGPWDVDAKGPLSQPGVNVKEGDFLLAVNGVPVDAGKDPWAAFQGLANRVVTITVNDSPSLERPAAEKAAEKKEEKQEEKTATDGTDGKDQKKKDDEKKKKTTGIRDVVVRCLGSEDDLRYRDWIETRRAMVEKETGGKVGYIHVPDTGQNGQNNLFRQFYGQIGKDALIIDERWNGGGQIPTRFIELLNRPRTNYWARRDGRDWPWPPDSHQGPKCMLINGLAGSGGDMFPWLFKHNSVGKLLGTRTWGGLVGISGNPGLVDGGSVTAPTFGFYETDGTWGIEGHGVDPDIEVIDDPAKMQGGADPQLAAAIKLMLEEIPKNGYKPPAKPKYPNRSGMGLPEADR